VSRAARGPAEELGRQREAVSPAEYRRLVRAVVASIPAGRVMSYGAIASYLADGSGRASPRLVGQIMARHGDGLPWHRVVRSDGQPARGHEARALASLWREGAPVRGHRVVMEQAAWAPEASPSVLRGRLRASSAMDRRGKAG
jgi:alkylated DNA nucleotide flippase Atl1